MPIPRKQEEMIDSGVGKGKSLVQGMRMKSRPRAAKKQSGHKAAVAALRAADAAWLKAYQARDAQKAAAFYDRQGAMLAPNAPLLTGKNALAKFIAKSFTLQDYKIKWRPNRADVACSGELGYTSGTYEMSFRDASGKRVSGKGKYLMVWKKQAADGTWKVLFDMSNSDSLPASRL
jgi:ketosteroid isomerase-like protein